MTLRRITLIKNVNYHGRGIRYVSRETTLDGITMEQAPVLELTDMGNHTLHLSFVRSTPDLSLDFLLERALSFAKHNWFHIVELQDDAFFKTNIDSPCYHRELFHRAFNGVKGIYESKGWKTSVETASLITCISSFTKGAAKELGPLLGTTLLNAFADDDHGSFGRWINSQPCKNLTFLYNGLLSLSSKTPLPPMSDGATKFVRALHDLRIANNTLHHEPAYTPPPR
jgi:hypothetical protein